MNDMNDFWTLFSKDKSLERIERACRENPKSLTKASCRICKEIYAVFDEGNKINPNDYICCFCRRRLKDQKSILDY
jgi:hypothetical protein